MAKDEAIRNQKVFVRLDAVLNLQREYMRMVTLREHEKSVNSNNISYQQGLEKAIQMLELPIGVSYK